MNRDLLRLVLSYGCDQPYYFKAKDLEVAAKIFLKEYGLSAYDEDDASNILRMKDKGQVENYVYLRNLLGLLSSGDEKKIPSDTLSRVIQSSSKTLYRKFFEFDPNYFLRYQIGVPFEDLLDFVFGYSCTNIEDTILVLSFTKDDAKTLMRYCLRGIYTGKVLTYLVKNFRDTFQYWSLDTRATQEQLEFLLREGMPITHEDFLHKFTEKQTRALLNVKPSVFVDYMNGHKRMLRSYINDLPHDKVVEAVSNHSPSLLPYIKRLGY